MRIKREFQISLILFLIIGIVLTFNMGMVLNKDINIPSNSLSKVASPLYQTVTVSCADVEDYGNGPYRSRICVDSEGEAHCGWDDHEYTTTYGECTFDSPDEE